MFGKAWVMEHARETNAWKSLHFGEHNHSWHGDIYTNNTSYPTSSLFSSCVYGQDTYQLKLIVCILCCKCMPGTNYAWQPIYFREITEKEIIACIYLAAM